MKRRWVCWNLKCRPHLFTGQAKETISTTLSKLNATDQFTAGTRCLLEKLKCDSQYHHLKELLKLHQLHLLQMFLTVKVTVIVIVILIQMMMIDYWRCYYITSVVCCFYLRLNEVHISDKPRKNKSTLAWQLPLNI